MTFKQARDQGWHLEYDDDGKHLLVRVIDRDDNPITSWYKRETTPDNLELVRFELEQQAWNDALQPGVIP